MKKQDLSSIWNGIILFTGILGVGATLINCNPKASPESRETEKQLPNLFILSGQSNMARLDPEASFRPALEKVLGQDQVVVVKDAAGGQPIRRWYKNWAPAEGAVPADNGDLYDQLMTKVTAAMQDKTFKTITFLWMQGERDARESHGAVYEKSLEGLFQQVREDLNRSDIRFVIGRLSDFDMDNARYPHWTLVRDSQVKIATSNPHIGWVDTDDLNDGLNQKGEEIKDDLHYSVEGYKVFGERLAAVALELINTEH